MKMAALSRRTEIISRNALPIAAICLHIASTSTPTGVLAASDALTTPTRRPDFITLVSSGLIRDSIWALWSRQPKRQTIEWSA